MSSLLFPAASHRVYLTCLALTGAAALTLPCHGQTLYDFGNPTAEEQLYIELINRARANPPAEGARLANTTDPDVQNAYSFCFVDLTMMQNEFNAIAATPPLVPNAKLTSIARSHSTWMLNNQLQNHNESPSNTPYSRMTNAGYSYSNAAENIYAFSKNVWQGHAGFQVDWESPILDSNGNPIGPGGPGGMQTGRGHRTNIHSGNFREIGVGITNGTNGSVGPQLVTQDFGTQSSNPTFGTGVAYYDLNGNNFYDIGEGISGLTVNVSGASYYCTTASGGGWAVPVPTTAATRNVTFSGLNINQTVNLTVPTSTNAKADLKLSYSPPQITSAATAYASYPHSLTFNAVGGATSYLWNRWNFGTATAENCNSTANITSSTTGSYSVLNSSIKYEGSASFHLENSTGASQWIELNPVYYGQVSPSISFRSRIRYATTSETFKVQIKEEGTSTWQDVFSQTGTNGSGETTFNLRSAALTGMTDKAFRVRFLLNFNTGSYYPNTGDIVGWFIDAIAFSGVSTLANHTVETLANTSGSFTPTAGTYLMSVSPVNAGNEFPASYQTLTVSSEVPPPSFTTWASNHESSNSLPAGSLADPNGDFDADGKPNLIEYAFGASPVTGNDPPASWPTTQTTATHYVLQYRRDTSLTDIAVTVEACSSFGNWKAPGDAGAPVGFTDGIIATNGNIQTREAKIPLSSGESHFMRVRVTRP